MKVKQLVAVMAILLLAACEQSNTAPASTDTKDAATVETSASTENTEQAGSLGELNEMDKISYAMGANSGIFLAHNLPEFEKWGMKVDPELIKKGFLEALEEKSEMTEQEIQVVLTAFQEQIKTKLAEVEKEQALKTAEANKLFLDANVKIEGVMTTESGIQYRILEVGTGANPIATDTVKVHYRGTLVSGEEFDSSYSRNQPAEFALNGVIAGWTEGVQLIKEGGKVELVLPPELAYGDRALPTIPANSVLVFEVELLEIIKDTPAETK